MSCTLYKHQDIFDLGPKIITGVICGGGPQIQYTLNFGESVCLDDDFAIIICDNIAIIGSCNFGPTPTPTNTSTIAATPTTTATPTRTIGLTPSNTQTQTNTPSITATQTPSSTIGSTPTQTPSQTMTRTPTMTPTSTACTNTNNCMEITVTGTSEEFFASIEYNNCYGTLINEVFTTNGTRYRCIQFVMGVEQIFSYTGIIPPTIFGGNCNTFECPTGVIPLTPSPTPTMTRTPTNTPTPTCSTFTTQYMRSEIQGTDDIRFTLFDNPDFTGNANAVCDYTITGTYNINGGAINQPYTTIMVNNDHNHTYNTGSNITGFTITSVVPACPCVLVVFSQVTPTPTGTPAITPTQTPSPSPSPSGETNCLCYCLTYTTVPNDLYVRYALCGTASVETELIQSLPILDNGDGTYTACICVRQGGSYQIPVCVQGGIEVTCDPYIWVQGSSCTTYSTCFLG